MAENISFRLIKKIDLHRDDSILFGASEMWSDANSDFSCVEVPDEFLYRFFPETATIKTFACSLAMPLQGIDHCGVTLIPPESAEELLNAIISRKNNPSSLETEEIICLLQDTALKNAAHELATEIKAVQSIPLEYSTDELETMLGKSVQEKLFVICFGL